MLSQGLDLCGSLVGCLGGMNQGPSLWQWGQFCQLLPKVI